MLCEYKIALIVSEPVRQYLSMAGLRRKLLQIRNNDIMS